MDEVLVAFRSGAEKVIGQPFPDADKEERWKDISQTKGFWANLDWMPGAKRLWNFISKYDTEILSAYSIVMELHELANLNGCLRIQRLNVVRLTLLCVLINRSMR